MKIVHSELVSFFLGVEGESSNFLDVTELTCKKVFSKSYLCTQLLEKKELKNISSIIYFFLHFISCIEETKDFVVKIDVIRNRKGDYGDALDVALKILADFIEIFLF